MLKVLLSKVRERKKSLKNSILATSAVVGVVLCLLYNFLMTEYFLLGLDSSMKLMLDTEAKAYERTLPAHTRTLPSGTNMRSFRSRDEMPQAWLNVFPVDEYSHRDFQVFHYDPDEPDEGISDQDIEQVCGAVDDCVMVFFYSYQLRDGSWVHISKRFLERDIDAKQEAEFDLFIWFATSVAAVCLITVLLLAWYLMRKIGTPISELAQWSDQLSSDNLDHPLPEMKYRELDVVRDKLHDAFGRIKHVIDHETRFLRNASHELRTPLATISSNAELLFRLQQYPEAGQDREDAILRIQRSAKNMQQLSETLLWLGGSDAEQPTLTQLSLGAICSEIIDDSRYLLEGKSVNVSLEADDSELALPDSALRIVVSNLIRNAFQHCNEGCVTVLAHGSNLSVSNSFPVIDQESTNGGMIDGGQHLSFGLGLVLVEQVCNKLSWRYEAQQSAVEHTAKICFRE